MTLPHRPSSMVRVSMTSTVLRVDASLDQKVTKWRMEDVVDQQRHVVNGLRWLYNGFASL